MAFFILEVDISLQCLSISALTAGGPAHLSGCECDGVKAE